MDSNLPIFSSFLIYIFVELVFRSSVMKFTTNIYPPFDYYLNWGFKIILSPGLLASENCKKLIEKDFSLERGRKERLAKFIKTSNCWNIIFSLFLLFTCIALSFLEIQANNSLFELFKGFVMWRYISRSFEIAIAFSQDILTSESKSSLDNHARMKLAIRSYFEIFIYSAAFYSAFSCDMPTIFEPVLTSLFVGTLTNVSGGIDLLVQCCIFSYDSEFWILLLRCSVYIQVFATLSLIFFGFAGYLSRVKTNKKIIS